MVSRIPPVVSLENITLSAGGQVEFNVLGRYFRVLSLSGSGVVVSFDDAPESAIFAGMAVHIPDHKPGFHKFKLRNTSGSSSVVWVAVSDGEIIDNRINISGSIVANGGSSIVTPAAASWVATTATLLVSADALRAKRLFQNNGSVDVWLGDSAIDISTSRGIKVVPGASLLIDSSGAVYGRIASGTGVISIMEFLV